MENPSERDRFDDLFQEKLAQFTPNLTPPAWTELAPLVSRRVSPTYPFRYVAAIALLIGGATFFLYEFTQIRKQVTTPLLAQVEDVTQLYQAESEVTNHPLPFSIQKLVDQEARLAPDHSIQEVAPIIDHSPVSTEIITASQSQNKEAVAKAGDSEPKERSQASVRRTYTTNQLGESFGAHEPTSRKKRRRATLHLLASNPLKNASPDGSQALFSMAQPPLQGSNVSGKLQNNFQPHDLAGFDHRLPLRFGVQAGYDCTTRLSVTSGLIYSYLRSNFDVLGDYALDGTQSLHYLGIPILLSYKLLTPGRFQLYLGAGAEININLQTTVSYWSVEDQCKMTFSDRRPVFGFGAKCGMAYRLLDRLHIYAEPEVMHYVTNASQRSYWTDQPAVFSLNIGLRTQF